MSFGTLYIARGIVFFFVCVVTVHAQVPVPRAVYAVRWGTGVSGGWKPRAFFDFRPRY